MTHCARLRRFKGQGEVLIPRPAFTLVGLLILLAATGDAALPIPAPPTRRVNDYAAALTAAERDRLERKLAEAEGRSSNQVIVAVFRSLQGESLEDYGIRLAQAWRIGQKGLDNGVIFLVFLEDRRMRLEVGYGLEPTLTDATAASIIRDVVAPRFRENRLADGIEAGLDAIQAAIAGTYGQPAGRPAGSAVDPRLVAGLAIMLLFGVPLLLITSAQARRRRRGWTAGRGGWYASSPGFGGGRWGGWSAGGGSASGGGESSSDSFGGGGGGKFGGGGASGGW